MKRYFIPLIMSYAAGIAAAQPAAIVVQQYSFAPVGVVTGATLRLNVTNISTNSNAVCTGNLSFLDVNGKSIKNEDITVNPGVTVSYGLVPTDISSSTTSAEVRGYVKINRQFGGVVASPVAPASCNALMSLEVVDSGGLTHAVLTNPALISGLPILTPVVSPPSQNPQ